MKYRAEIDGLRAVAVLPVILFHAGFSLFAGGYVGVDIFFVISGYLITTILVDDIEKQRFSIVGFYERRARRILPALTAIALVTTFASFFILYPADFLDLSKSLVSVATFVSNIFFWKTSDYFATASELVPLLHTWSLSVEEQYYLLFPPFLFFAWRYGKERVFWLIAGIALFSLLLSEWAWRVRPEANFYLTPTRAWELLAGSLAAFIVQKRGVRKNNLLSLAGLGAILFSIFVYDTNTPFPSIYTLVPVAGVVLLVLYADRDTVAARLLGARWLVGIGLVSYSAYLWHQPLLALSRRVFGLTLGVEVVLALIVVTFVLSYLTWRWVEQPFRDRKKVSVRAVWMTSLCSLVLLVSLGVGGWLTSGAAWRFELPDPPHPWTDVVCHGAARIKAYPDPLASCLGESGNDQGGDIYLLGDSHAAQLTFPLAALASETGKQFYFINTEDRKDFPYSFWAKRIDHDRILDHVIANADPGDFVLVAFHRGRLNEKRDVHLSPRMDIEENEKTLRFAENMIGYMPRLATAGLNVVLVMDGPLLSDQYTSLEACLDKFNKGVVRPCAISYQQDDHTRTRQRLAYNRIQQAFPEEVSIVDPLPALYQGEAFFSPVDGQGNYRMFDRHHLTERASLQLVDFFRGVLRRSGTDGLPQTPYSARQ